MLDKVLSLGCEGARYNADSIASAPARNKKIVPSCTFYYLCHWQALQICHLLGFLC